MSYRKSNPETTPIKLHNLSPEKYGKAAFDENRCYTPSKLADNVLYREVTTMKKVEEGNGKLREVEALNSLLRERLAQADEEKEGIEKTMGQQIVMYKKMLKQKEENNELRIRQTQNSFREEIKTLILQKEEESKYFQSEKQLLEERIQQLENHINLLNQEMHQKLQASSQLQNDKEKLELHLSNLQDQFNKNEADKNEQISRLENRYSKLQEDHKQAQAEWKVQTEGALYKKDLEREALKKQFQEALEKSTQQLKHSQERSQKTQRDLNILIEELKKTIESEGHHHQMLLDAESKRHFEAIEVKESVIERLNRQIMNLRDQNSTLGAENSKLAHELGEYTEQNKLLAYELKEYDILNGKEKDSLLVHIESLKEELKLNQLNFIREKDKNIAFHDENRVLQSQSHNVEILTQEVNKLRELLLESSREIQVCREKFVAFERENRTLRHEMDRLVSENDSLLRLRRELQEEAIKWRQNYLRVTH